MRATHPCGHAHPYTRTAYSPTYHSPQIVGSNVYGSAIPTVPGVENALAYICKQEMRLTGKTARIVWVSLREEPVLYVNTRYVWVCFGVLPASALLNNPTLAIRTPTHITRTNAQTRAYRTLLTLTTVQTICPPP